MPVTLFRRQQHSYKDSIANRRRVLHVAETSCSLEFLAWPSHIKDEAELLRSKSGWIKIRWKTDLAEQIADRCIIKLFREVRDIQRRAPCQMHADLSVMYPFLVLCQSAWYAVLKNESTCYYSVVIRKTM